MKTRSFQNKIAIIGPYPPPYGGISVHIQRTLALLDPNECILFCETTPSPRFAIPFTGRSRLFKALGFFFWRTRLIHHHSPDINMRILLCLVGLMGRKVYLHIHGASLEDSLTKNPIRAWLLKHLLRFVHVLSDNTRITAVARPLSPRSIHEIDAFLPPKFDSQLLEAFDRNLKLPKAHTRIFMCGWFTVSNGTDLYGFDIALKALQRLRRDHGKDVIILACVNGIQNEELYESFLKQRDSADLKDFFLLYPSNFQELWPFYLHTDILLRPTSSDGSALSVKEALWFDTTVLASDCVPRPTDCHLFQNRSVDDLVDKLLKLMNAHAKTPFESKRESAGSKRFSYPLIEKIYNESKNPQIVT